MVGQVTGGNPRAPASTTTTPATAPLLPAGTTNCAGATPGVEVTYFEQLDKNPLAIDAGQGLTRAAGQHPADDRQPDDADRPDTAAGRPDDLPAGVPAPVPEGEHDLRGRARGGPADRLVGQAPRLRDPQRPVRHRRPGPLHAGDQQRRAGRRARRTTGRTDNALTQQYDSYKVQAVLNEINGFDHSGTNKVGTPAIFGMNFQTVSTAEKLPTSDGLTGGYLADGVTPGPLLRARARLHQHQRRRDGERDQAPRTSHRQHRRSSCRPSTASHPTDPSALTRIRRRPDHRRAQRGLGDRPPDGDRPAGRLRDRRRRDADLAATTAPTRRRRSPRRFLLGPLAAPATTSTATRSRTRPRACTTVYAGADAAAYFGVPLSDPRVPDVIGISQYGVVYTGKTGEDRRARRRQPAGPRRAARRLRRAIDDPRRRRLVGRDDPDRPDHPRTARPRPRRPTGGPDRAHASAAARSLATWFLGRRGGYPRRANPTPVSLMRPGLPPAASTPRCRTCLRGSDRSRAARRCRSCSQRPPPRQACR